MANSVKTPGGIDLSNQLAMDANGLSSLKRSAKEDSPEAIKGVAKQFEAVMMNMMLKSMRDATPQDGLFDSEQSKLYTSMLDQQLSQTLSAKGMGLADVLVRQLTKVKAGANPLKDGSPLLSNNFHALNAVKSTSTLQASKLSDSNAALAVKSPKIQAYQAAAQSSSIKPTLSPAQESAVNFAMNRSEDPEILSQIADAATTQLGEIAQPWIKDAADQIERSASVLGAEITGAIENQAIPVGKEIIDQASKAVNGMAKVVSSNSFVNKMASHARQASLISGLPAHFIMGQAALETGWGAKEIRAADGSNSHNLFGIKANANWTGKVVSVATTEYIHGIKQQRIEKFRAYDSYAESFKDFATMIKNSPRYQGVMNALGNAGSYAQAIQNAGYSTDPQYANKLASVITKINQNTP
jgi:flagellar protein FlgJ